MDIDSMYEDNEKQIGDESFQNDDDEFDPSEVTCCSILSICAKFIYFIKNQTNNLTDRKNKYFI